MKKILVLGAGGMAGHVMAEVLSQIREYEIIRGDLTAVTPDTIILDVTDSFKLEGILHARRPEFVINCVGLLVKASQERLDRAILINSFLPHFLSRLGRANGFKLIHISTDCVFSGDRGGYAEDDFRDGDTPYARTKALGEVINDVDLTLRTSIIGPELIINGTGLLHWFLTQKGVIKGYSKALWSGVTTLELAKVVDQCIRHGVSGLVNLAMNRKISKYDLLIACQKIWDHGQIRVLPDDSHASDKSLVSSRTDLPFHLPPSYPALLAELRDFMNQHRDQYRHYKW
jgi:dTDP-4-dehydrorhamnose reductase